MEKDYYYLKRSIHNGISFLIFSALFFVYWILFLFYGMNHQPNNFVGYLVFTIIELIINAAIIFFAILSLRKNNREQYARFFVLDWILLAVATFPMPFAYLFGAGFQNTPEVDEIAAISTPICVLCFLALVFALASYSKLSDGKIHKALLNLTVICLLVASIFVFLCLLYKVSTETNPNGFLNNIYIYCGLAILYLGLCIYGLVSIHKEMERIPAVNKRGTTKKSLFTLTNSMFMGYSFLTIVVGIYGLSTALFTNELTINVRYGAASQAYLVGDYIFELVIGLAIALYTFYLFSNLNNKKDSLFAFAVLFVLITSKFLVPSLVGSYGLITTYLSTRMALSNNIILTFTLVTLSAVGFGTALGALFLANNHRQLSAFYLSVAAFMLGGIYLTELSGLIYTWATAGLNWFRGLLSIVTSLPDLAMAIVSICALAREYPAAKEEEKSTPKGA